MKPSTKSQTFQIECDQCKCSFTQNTEDTKVSTSFSKDYVRDLWTSELDYKTNELHYFKATLRAKDNLMTRFITCPVCNNTIVKTIGDWLYPAVGFVAGELFPHRGWLLESYTEITRDELYEHFGWLHKKTESKSNSTDKKSSIFTRIKKHIH